MSDEEESQSMEIIDDDDDEIIEDSESEKENEKNVISTQPKEENKKEDKPKEVMKIEVKVKENKQKGLVKKIENTKIVSKKEEEKDDEIDEIIHKETQSKMTTGFNVDNSKTIFTKLTEEMFDNLKSNRKKNNYVYDSFINEQFLSKYSEKFNDNNKNIVNDFVNRNVKDSNRKKLGVVEQRKKDSARTEKTKKPLITNPTINNKTTKKKKDEFFTEQKNFMEMKQKKLNDMKNKLFKEEKQNIRNKPLINSKSIDIINRKNRFGKKELSRSVFDKLYDDRTKYKKSALMLQKDNSSRSVAQKRIKSAEPRVNNDSINRLHLGESPYKKKTPVFETQSEVDLTSTSSNTLLIQKILRNIDIEFNRMFNSTSETNFKVNINQFMSLLHSLGFIHKKYSNETNNKDKEFQLVKDAWKVLTRKNNNDKDIVDSYYIILFLLCVLDLYRGGYSPVIQKNLPFIDTTKYNISEKLAKQIKLFFRQFADNEMNYIFKNNKYDNYHSFVNNTETNNSSRKKLNKIKSNNSITGRRIAVTEAYDLDKKKREQQLEILRKRKEKEEEKECTFFPNGKRPKSTTSREVSNRLYSIPKKQKNTILQTNPNEKETYDFKPELTQYNKKMFNYNPIKDDKLVNEKIEQYEKARIDKKVSNYLKKQGTHSISHLKTFDEVVNDIVQTDTPTRWKFDNEKKIYKDTFERFNPKKKKDKRKIQFIFEIKVEDKIKQLKIYKGDNIEKDVDTFCNENNLEWESKEQILSAIKDKM